MGMPNIPDVSPNINIKRKDSINLLLASIAFEELGLAHIINAEGEKIQCITGQNCPCDIDDLVDINESVSNTLRNVIKAQMLLQFKLEDIIELIDNGEDCKKKKNKKKCKENNDKSCGSEIEHKK